MDDNAKISKLPKSIMLMLGTLGTEERPTATALLRCARRSSTAATGMTLMTRFGPWYTRLRQRELSSEDRGRLLRDMRFIRREDEFCRLHRGDSDEALPELASLL